MEGRPCTVTLPSRGSGDAVINSKTVCDGQEPLQHCMRAVEMDLSVCHKMAAILGPWYAAIESCRYLPF